MAGATGCRKLAQLENEWHCHYARSGEHFRIEGHIDGPRLWPFGPIIDPPTLTIRVDKNFDHDFLDAGETVTHDWNGDSYSGYFYYDFAIDDDGQSPVAGRRQPNEQHRL